MDRNDLSPYNSTSKINHCTCPSTVIQRTKPDARLHDLLRVCKGFKPDEILTGWGSVNGASLPSPAEPKHLTPGLDDLEGPQRLLDQKNSSPDGVDDAHQP